METRRQRALNLVASLTGCVAAILCVLNWVAVGAVLHIDVLPDLATLQASGLDALLEFPWFGLACSLIAGMVALVALALHALGRRVGLWLVGPVLAACAAPFVLPAGWTGITLSTVMLCEELPCLPGGRGVHAEAVAEEVFVSLHVDLEERRLRVHLKVDDPEARLATDRYPLCRRFDAWTVSVDGQQLEPDQDNLSGSIPDRRRCYTELDGDWWGWFSGPLPESYQEGQLSIDIRGGGKHHAVGFSDLVQESALVLPKGALCRRRALPIRLDLPPGWSKSPMQARLHRADGAPVCNLILRTNPRELALGQVCPQGSYVASGLGLHRLERQERRFVAVTFSDRPVRVSSPCEP